MWQTSHPSCIIENTVHLLIVPSLYDKIELYKNNKLKFRRQKHESEIPNPLSFGFDILKLFYGHSLEKVENVNLEVCNL